MFLQIVTFNLLLLLSLGKPSGILATDDEHIWKRVTQTGAIRLMDSFPLEETSISAIVGYGQITIEGYTSPEANITLTSSQANLSLKTVKANNEGYFKFKDVIFPQNPGELWLQATDIQGLTTPPLAIPEPTTKTTSISGLILPPTLSQTNGQFKQNSRSLSFGRAIPNSQVEIYVFQTKESSWFKRLLSSLSLAPKKAWAQNEEYLSLLSIKTDQDGYFSFDLPNQGSQTYRYYAGNIFQDNFSPKSNILSFRVLNLIEAIYQQIITFAANILALIISLIKNLLFWILVEIILIFFIIKRLKRDEQQRQNSALIS